MAESSDERIVVLLDMDCFFCQVEVRLQPEHKGKPLAVVQYNPWRVGGIIAVNYEAKEFGVTRGMKCEEAKEKCPDIVLATVPCSRNKADISRYRSAGREVLDILKNHCSIIERASIDEAYLDITDIVEKRMVSVPNISEIINFLKSTYVVGHSELGRNNEEERNQGTKNWVFNAFEDFHDLESQKLAIAGIVMEEIRDDIFKTTGFTCSAGISQNKILAKLACGLHKPNNQTILPSTAVQSLYSTLPVKKVRNLGGKFGNIVVDSLGCNVMGDLIKYPLSFLQKRFDKKTGLWLYNIARGIDNEPVVTRLVPKSIGACKTFPGKQVIKSSELVIHWFTELSEEICDRLKQDMEENQRRATSLTISYHYYKNNNTVTQSRSVILNSYKPEIISKQSIEIVNKPSNYPISFLGLSASKFIPINTTGHFKHFFKTRETDDSCSNNVLDSESSYENVGSTDSQDKTDFKPINNLENISSSSLKKNHISETAGISSESPTTLKLYKLIRACNEQNELRNKKSSFDMNSKMLSNDSATEKYKESFFMNFLQQNVTTEKDKTDNEKEIKKTVRKSLEYSEESSQFMVSEKNSEISNNENNKLDLEKCHPLLSDDQMKSNSKLKNNLRREIQSSNLEGSINKTNFESIPKNSKNLIALQEIFPDLNNIDPDIVSMLPIELQQEAKKYINQENENDKNCSTGIDKTKNLKNSNSIKLKNKESKKGKDNLIHSYLIKNSSASSNNESFKRCEECGQMILKIKFEEHADYHIALSLQQEMQKSSTREENTKRKSVSPPDKFAKKRLC